MVQVIKLLGVASPAEMNKFFKSETVNNADKALKKHEASIVIKDINEYNKGKLISNFRFRRKKEKYFK